MTIRAMPAAFDIGAITHTITNSDDGPPACTVYLGPQPRSEVWMPDSVADLDAVINGLTVVRYDYAEALEQWQARHGAVSDLELPGMWEAADFTGGKSDAEDLKPLPVPYAGYAAPPLNVPGPAQAPADAVEPLPPAGPGTTTDTCVRCGQPIIAHDTPEPHHCHVDRSITHLAHPAPVPAAAGDAGEEDPSIELRLGGRNPGLYIDGERLPDVPKRARQANCTPCELGNCSDCKQAPDGGKCACGHVDGTIVEDEATP